jgi:hypothetical protein
MQLTCRLMSMPGILLVHIIIYFANILQEKHFLNLTDLGRCYLLLTIWLESVEADLPVYAFNRPDFFNMASRSFSELARSKKICFLYGRFFRDYENIESCGDLIRSYFTPIDEINEDLNRFHTSLRYGTDLLVGVHIRRGDYKQFVDGKYFFSIDDYLHKMNEVNQALAGRRVRFVVCSNEEIAPSRFAGLQVSIGPRHHVKDMYLLAKCDYIMGPPSTYTLWASFYGRKPLYQIQDIQTHVSMDKFVLLPATILYNFSFN